VEGGLRSSIHRVSWEQAYLTIDRPRRAQTKLVVDGIAGRLAEGGIALILLAWLRFAVGDRPLVGSDGGSVDYLLLYASLAWLGLTITLSGQAGAAARWGKSPARLPAALPLPDT
jgi:hypothetical protein